MRSPIALVVLLLLSANPAAAEGGLRRFAIVAAASDGGPGRTVLRYSTADARQVARVLRRLGGVAIDDLQLIEEPDAAALRATFASVAAEAGAARRAGQRVEVFLYYSGHSDDRGLLLGGSQLPYADLRAALAGVPADVRVAILDSCASGAFTRLKGGVRRPPFLLDSSSQVKGHAFLTSSAADEASQESERLKGSFFTHALLSGLRGGADASGDRVVTLNEAYQFAYRETLARTETTRAGPQHATYDIGLVGSGDVVMTDLRRADAVLVVPSSLEGTVFVRNAAGQLVAELRKIRGAGVELALEEGRYDVRVSWDRRVSSTQVDLPASARVVLEERSLVATALEDTVVRGGAAAASDPETATAPAPVLPGEPAAEVAEGMPPMALPGFGSSAPPPPQPRTPAPVPLDRPSGRWSWLAASGGVAVSQEAIPGAAGLALQLAIGTWLRDFVGLELSMGYRRMEGETDGSVVINYDPGNLANARGDHVAVRDSLQVIPVAATLKLALPSEPLRPYLLLGAGLDFVTVVREVEGAVYNLAPDTRRMHMEAMAFAYHVGLGASVQIAPRVHGVFEARYLLGSANLRYARTELGSAGLGALQVTAGLGYTF